MAGPTLRDPNLRICIDCVQFTTTPADGEDHACIECADGVWWVYVDEEVSHYIRAEIRRAKTCESYQSVE